MDRERLRELGFSVEGDEIVVEVRVGDDRELLRVPIIELDSRTEEDDDRYSEAARALAEAAAAEQKTDVHWQPAPRSKQEYVERANSADFVPGLAAGKWPANPNLFAFENAGGLFNKGVCWWHSRIQRAALYLTYFEPGEPPPGEADARRIIARLMSAAEVVAIPGYESFAAFSEAHRGLIQRKLDRTQILEGLFKFSWINGLAGAPKLAPEKMKRQMDEVFAEVRDHGTAYVKLQSPGVDSHAWLVTEMLPTDGGGYRYRFIDSNNPMNPLEWSYTPGETHIQVFQWNLGAPYLQRSRELSKIRGLVRDFCCS